MAFIKSIIAINIAILSHQLLEAQNSFSPEYSAILDSSKGAALMEQCTRCTPRGITNFWNITESDKVKIEVNFKKILHLKSSDCSTTYPNDSLQTVEHYLYQYIGVNIAGRKLVYINAFVLRDTKDRWKTEPVNVCDGGKGFWGALFDIESLEFSQLSFNDAG